MKTTIMKAGLVVMIVTCILGVQLHAQNTTGAKFNRLSIGLHASHLYDVKFKPNQMQVNGFLGEDMQGLKGSKTKFDMSFGADVSYFFTPLFSMDVSYAMGKMSGSGAKDYYVSDVSFLTLGANLALKRAIRTTPYKLVPYLRVSMGSGNYASERKFIEDDVTFNSTKGSCLQVGLGAGLRYHISHNLHLNLMSEFVTNYTDDWDGYGYNSGNDNMVRTTLGLRYTFGKNPHADRALAWQDNRVDKLTANNTDLLAQSIKAMSDSLRLMNESMARMKQELSEKMAYDNADNDNDGVLNRNDLCPNQYGPAYTGGCPDTTTKVKRTPEPSGMNKNDVVMPINNEQAPTTSIPAGTLSSLDLQQVRKMLLIEMSNINFPSGKASLSEEAKAILNRNAQVLKANSNFVVIITGYTDFEGSNQRNLKLSSLRANAVANYLIKQGVSKSQLVTKALGKKNPLNKGAHAKDKAQNRRVEFEVQVKN
jgi:outer membrane protein OmpA-like peptidoglycan-associated protein